MKEKPPGSAAASVQIAARVDNVLGGLDEEFAEKERLSYGQEWCAPVPHERKVKTAQDFYKAFHETRTLPILTCMFCYRKYSRAELEDVEWDWWMASPVEKRDGSPFKCLRCFPVGEKIRGCADCVRQLTRGALFSAACVGVGAGIVIVAGPLVSDLVIANLLVVGLAIAASANTGSENIFKLAVLYYEL